MSIAAVVRQAVDDVIPADADARRHRIDRARAVVGAFASGKRDIAERHDDYLGESDRW